MYMNNNLVNGCIIIYYTDKISRCSDLNQYESYDELEEYVKKSPGCKYKWKLEVND